MTKNSVECVLEPRKPGRVLYARIVGEFCEILSLLDTLEDLHAATFSATSNQPLGIGPSEHHPTNVVQASSHLRDQIQRVVRNCEDRDRVTLRGGVIAIRDVQVWYRKLLVWGRDKDFRREHVVRVGERVPFRWG